ncbi:MOSC domain-containing protein [Haloarchaeobius sp. TZWWS8]|uniref:MOSC domain-containing protein n=1 Tax=Haloarchaeobius sp. TZWWS8 TaxID=3446121 RepID=UPI003EB9987A
MQGTGTVEAVYIAGEAGDPVQAVEAAEAVARRGLRGDRYFVGDGTFASWDDEDERPAGYDLTLIETEAVAAIEREADIALEPGEHRRNVETRDVALNHLVGKRFRVGEVVCRGDRLCEPCDYLQRKTEDGVLDALLHRGGLRADIVEGGTIRPGDVVEPLD